MIYKKDITTRIDCSKNGIIIRIPCEIARMLNISAKQTLEIQVQDDLKSFVVKVKE